MSLAGELERLHALRTSGALTEDEYAAAKARLLAGDAAPRPLAEPVREADRTVFTEPLERLNRLRLSNSDSVVAGVCGGLAAWSGVPALVWRIGFLVALLGYGVGFLPYVVLWICVPRDSG
jgi:phage shock protein PspC (stress-responsive transcriptional regulator)